MKHICTNCNTEFSYMPSQSLGKYCSHKCRGEYMIKQRFTTNVVWNKKMGHYLKEIRGNKCEVCNITEHNNKPLTFQIDHVNGDRMDNRFENLKVICPNCHTQTKTWGAGNVSEEGKIRMIEGAKKGAMISNSRYYG
jgi:hypothetical protein